MDFVQQKYPGFAALRKPLNPYVSGELAASIRLVQWVDNPLEFRDAARITIVDFQPKPRIFRLWSDSTWTDPNDNLKTVYDHLRAMKRFLRGTPPSSKGLVILWDRVPRSTHPTAEFWLQSAVMLGLAEALWAMPKIMVDLNDRMRRKERSSYGINRSTAYSYLERALLRDDLRKSHSANQTSYCSTLHLPLSRIDIYDLCGSCALVGVSFPICKSYRCS